MTLSAGACALIYKAFMLGSIYPFFSRATKAAGSRVKVEHFGQINMMYACITVLRALGLKEGPRKIWEDYTKYLHFILVESPSQFIHPFPGLTVTLRNE